MAKKTSNDKPRSSDKQTARAVIEASRRCLVEHYEHRNINAVIDCMADDITWIGPMDCQHCRSAEAMRAILEPEYGTPVYLHDERWDARRVGDTWIASGLYAADVSDAEGSAAITFHQCATFVWAMTPRGLRVVHLHVSNAYDIPPRLNQPVALGEDAVVYSVESVKEGLKEEGSKSRKIAFQNVMGTMNYLDPDEVRCLVVDGPQTVRVEHERGSFSVRGALSDLAKKLPAEFVRSHRSCIVNATHVVETARYRALLDDGSRCPIAEKRYREVVAAIDAAVAS